MNTINELHEKAMELADEALHLKRQGDEEHAQDLLREAMTLEVEAATQLANGDSSTEPTRSILLRSAAALALDCHEYREAERLVAIALTGDPPSEIASELRDLFDRANFERHLQVKGITLGSNEFQISVSGGEVGFGVALTDIVIKRITDIDKLLKRTVERKRGVKFRTSGAARGGISDSYDLYMSAPRAGSLAVTLQVGRQSQLPGIDDTEEIVDEFLECLALASNNMHDELRHRMDDNDYFTNFVRLTKNIAPDGKQVTQVGITRVRNGVESRISIILPRDQIQDVSPQIDQDADGDGETQPITIIGFLQYADKTKTNNEIRLVDQTGKKHRVIVPDAYMNDIVRPLWDNLVSVKGVTGKGGVVYLRDIEAVDR